MRVQLTLYTKNEQKINLNYNYYLSALIYKFLYEFETKSSVEFHNEGFKIESKKCKWFCFSNLLPMNDYMIEKNNILLKGKINWYISSPNMDFLHYFINVVLKTGKIKINNCEFEVPLLNIIKKDNFDDNIYFKALSPITVQAVEIINGKRKVNTCAPSDIKFTDNIVKNLKIKASKIFKKSFDDVEIKIDIDDIYKNYKGTFVEFKNMLIEGYPIPLKIKASSEIMSVIYDCGIGEKNWAGFGFVDI